LALEGLELEAVAGGTRVRLRVKPGARRDAIVGVHGGALKVAVNAAPEHGKANDAVIALLAARLAVPRSSVVIVAGASSQDKVAEIALETGAVARLAAAGFPGKAVRGGRRGPTLR
jgi:uncharacterized protein (TIGR00251 family)